MLGSKMYIFILLLQNVQISGVLFLTYESRSSRQLMKINVSLHKALISYHPCLTNLCKAVIVCCSWDQRSRHMGDKWKGWKSEKTPRRESCILLWRAKLLMKYVIQRAIEIVKSYEGTRTLRLKSKWWRVWHRMYQHVSSADVFYILRTLPYNPWFKTLKMTSKIQ